MIGRWMGLLVARAALSGLVRACVSLGLVGLAIAGGPVALVAACAYLTAWWRGWQARQLLVAAAWCAPMALVWLVAVAGRTGLLSVGTAPYDAWLAFWHLAGAGSYPRAVATIAPEAVPIGLLIA